MKEQRAGKWNVVDITAVVLIALIALLVVWRLVSGREDTGRKVTMTYTVLVEGAASELYKTVQPHLPSTLMASGKLLDGEILSVRQEPHYELGPDGRWVKDPNHVNLYFTCINHTEAGEVLLSKVDEQEVRIGRKDYTLKSEYIEFHNTTILDVEWEWDDGQDNEAGNTRADAAQRETEPAA